MWENLILELELISAREPASKILESLFFWEQEQFQEQFQFLRQGIVCPGLMSIYGPARQVA